MSHTALSCFVSMPFGKRPDRDGRLIDFNAVYANLIKPAVLDAGLTCERGDPSESDLGPNIQKALLRLLLQSDLMIADITTANPNVLYDVGIRFATHPKRTLLIDGSNVQVPFALNLVPRLRYTLSGEGPDPVSLSFDRGRLATAVRRAIDSPSITSPLFDYFPRLNVHLPKDPCVFIGHGRSPLWRRLQKYLEDDLKIATLSYESESQVGRSIVQVLETMLTRVSFAILVMTAEDVTNDHTFRARQNVIHEAGLFQGSLGFARAILLRQDTVEEFSNIDGLQHIVFAGDAIDDTFPELLRVLKREGMMPAQSSEA